MGEAAVKRLVHLDRDSDEIRDSQAAIANLLDKEAVAQELYEELPAIADQLERCDRGAQLYQDCDDLVSLAKELEGVLARVRKRMVKVQETVKEGLLEEAVSAGGEIETASWLIKTRKNPARVVIDDLVCVPKKYRLEPRPIPPWQEWDVDKNQVKQALGKGLVKKIDGVHLEQGERVEIKPR